MFSEGTAEIFGVAAFIVKPPHDVLTIEEFITKRSTNKIAGQRSVPMETVEEGEDIEHALKRLLDEEIRVKPLVTERLTQHEICRFRPLGHILVRTFYLEANNLSVVLTGSEVTEVGNPEWEPITTLIGHPLGSRRYRGGNRESGWSGLNFHMGKNQMPDIYESVIDEIPSEAFDMLEAIQSKESFQ